MPRGSAQQKEARDVQQRFLPHRAVDAGSRHDARLIAFIESRDVPGIPAGYDAGINRGLGVPSGFYHFAFEAGSEASLKEKRRELLAKGVDVTDVIDHDWEFCCITRNLNADDARMQHRHEISVRRLNLDPDAMGSTSGTDAASKVVADVGSVAR